MREENEGMEGRGRCIKVKGKLQGKGRDKGSVTIDRKDRQRGGKLCVGGGRKTEREGEVQRRAGERRQ